MNMVKYPGGKERELDVIHNFMPERINNYYEPFVGGGAVYLSVDASHYFINDFSKDLINLYQCVADRNEDFFIKMALLNGLWKSIDKYAEKENELFHVYTSFRDGIIKEDVLIDSIRKNIEKNKEVILSFITPIDCGDTDHYIENLPGDFAKKFIRMKKLNFTKMMISDEDIRANILGVYKAAFYTYIRSLYNRRNEFSDGFKAMLYLFIRDFCYSSMFRYNANGEFNVPYGGISYNKKNYDGTFEKYDSLQISERIKRTTLGCADYLEFLRKYQPEEGDFLFLDPPYDSSFSTYDQNPFDAKEQECLASYLINECRCSFMLDIKYTDYIASLYPEGTKCRNGGEVRIESFDKNYSVSFMNRNDKKAKHILVLNYQAETGSNKGNEVISKYTRRQPDARARA